MKEKLEHYNNPLAFFLGIVVFVFVIHFVSDWSNKAENTKYKQDQVDNYDAFYSDCKDYFTENKSMTEDKVETTCKSLEKYSKGESKQVIYDIDNPSRDEQPSKDCDVRGCTYSN